MPVGTKKDPVTEQDIRAAFSEIRGLGKQLYVAEDIESVIQRLAFEREQLIQTLRDIDHTTTCKITRLKTQTLVNTVYKDI